MRHPAKISLALYLFGAIAAHAQGPGGPGGGPGPVPSPWIKNGPTVYYNDGGVALPSSVTGGGKGTGTINVQGYYLNGALAATTVNGVPCQLGSTCTITASAGTITIGTTTVAGGNGILYNNTSSGPLTALSPVASSVVTFNGSGTPLATTALPSGLTATNMTLTTPNLGTPSAVTLTNGTGLPISSGVSGLATGMATFLGTPSSANLASTITDETGSGLLVFGTNPAITTPTISSPTVTGAFTATGLVTFADMASAALATASQYNSGAASTLIPASVIYVAENAVTFNSTPNFDLNASFNFSITMTGNITSFTFSNAKANQAFQIRFIQDATGSRTLSGFPSILKFPSGVTPTLTTAANAVDAIIGNCISTSYCVASFIANVK